LLTSAHAKTFERCGAFTVIIVVRPALGGFRQRANRAAQN
jgi:hypothetical protein